MRFAAPLSAPDELLPLREAGADEIYFGLLEDAWRARFGGHDSVSRRQGAANLRTRDELKRLALLCRETETPAYLALNGRCTPDMTPYLLELCGVWSDLGGTGVILRDLALASALKERKLPLKVTASLLSVTVNADGVRFLRAFGVSRVVLPRFLTPEEMVRIASACPETEFEVMLFGDRCPMIDGFCRGYHGETFVPAPAGTEPLRDMACFDPSGCSGHLCAGIPREPDPCAACLMPFFDAAGITVGKLGGRGTPPEDRLRALRFLRAARNGEDVPDRLYRTAFGHACSCYYPGKGGIGR